MDKIIVVGHTEIDEYGNLQVTDKGGGITKISVKREHLFPLFEQGKAVKLDIQTYKGKNYVADAELVEGALPSSQESKQEPKSKDDIIRENMEWKADKIEQAMWWKELGECLRCGDINKTTPEGKLLRNAYYAEMLKVLGLKFKEG